MTERFTASCLLSLLFSITFLQNLVHAENLVNPINASPITQVPPTYSDWLEWIRSNNCVAVVRQEEDASDGKKEGLLTSHITGIPFHDMERVKTISFEQLTATKITKALKFFQTDSNCGKWENCVSFIKELHAKQMSENRELSYAFHLTADGRIFESLGWEKTRKDDLIFINFLTASKNTDPSSKALASFSCLVRKGVDLRKIRYELGLLYPSHTANSLDATVWEWFRWSVLALGESGTVNANATYGDIEVVTREIWDAVNPLRTLDELDVAVRTVEVSWRQSNCYSYSQCEENVRSIQGENFITHSDIYANFLFPPDGRIYEGLGWETKRKGDTLCLEFLSKSGEVTFWTPTLAAFALLLRKGLSQGKVSKNFSVLVKDNVSVFNKGEILKWAEWSKNILNDNVTLTMSSNDGQSNAISRIDQIPSGPFNCIPLDNPVTVVRLKLTQCSHTVTGNCVPYFRCLESAAVRSVQEVDSNFYLTDDGLVYKGLGWENPKKSKVTEVSFEFFRKGNKIPNAKTMAAFGFLLREGTDSGKLAKDYRISVEKDASLEFENEVRLWHRWSRYF